MTGKENLDEILRDWPYEPDGLSVRLVQGRGDREVIQVRVDMGVLQLETTGRPDGTRPSGHDTYYDFLHFTPKGSKRVGELIGERVVHGSERP